MRTWLLFTLACLAFPYAETRILFPDEIPTLSSFIYSLLPPIKLGQDSRFGFGFKLGRNADAQFIIELGPQQATQPLGNESKKREVSSNTRRVLSPGEREKLLRKFLDKIKSSELVESTTLISGLMNNTSDDNKQT